MLRPRHALILVILTTAVCALMSGAFANTAAANNGSDANYNVTDEVDETNAPEDEDDAESVTVNCMFEGEVISCTGPHGTWWDGRCYVDVYSDDPSDPNPSANHAADNRRTH
jgi:hypothetical protein